MTIAVLHLPAHRLIDLLRTPFAVDELAGEPGNVVLIELTQPASPSEPALRALATMPVIVIGLAEGKMPDGAATLADVILDPESPTLTATLETIAAHPVAATTLVMLLRGSDRRTIEEGLLAESTAYSMLQGGLEFATWRAAHPISARGGHDTTPALRWSRQEHRLDIELCRPHVRNAYNRAMRDELIEALAVAAADDSITHIDLRGTGPSFCSGGDLDEFGSRSDPATAHLIRMGHSAARLLHRLADRVTVHLHGACMGSGIELPAFAAHIIATPDTRIGLPEIALGLIPGAGGTVSLPRRIGRHRTAELALSGTTIGVDTALAWGLADEVLS
ncbi:MAG: enoyl-CoA hydratase/isomerase family protein [Acidimicrobiales bacterium]